MITAAHLWEACRKVSSRGTGRQSIQRMGLLHRPLYRRTPLRYSPLACEPWRRQTRTTYCRAGPARYSELRLVPGSTRNRNEFSPSGRFFLDTHSDINRPTETDLRRADGRLIEVLSEGVPSEGVPAEDFQVKAADGATELYSVIYRADNFDPARSIWCSFPVRGTGDDAGSPPFRHRRAGTNSRQFGHDHVVLDARAPRPRQGLSGRGLPQCRPRRIGTMCSVATARHRYSLIDANRAAVLGGSLGGYFAVRAMLQAPDFFKVGIAMCPATRRTCVSGWALPATTKRGTSLPPICPSPPTSRVISCRSMAPRILNAEFASTIRLIDALVRANKPYDLILMPEQDIVDRLRPMYSTRSAVSDGTPGLGETMQRAGLDYVWIPPGTFVMGCSRDDKNVSDGRKHPIRS